MTRFATGVLCIWLSSASLLSADLPKRYALLVGVSKYDHSSLNRPEPLQYPEADAKALGEFLRAGGYETELLLGKEATGTAVRAKLERLSEQGEADGVVLVGLFGHGVEVETIDDRNMAVLDGCFCPYDTRLRAVKDGKGNAIYGTDGQALIEPDPASLVKLSELMTALKLAKAANRVVLADCCRTVPNRARGRSFGAGFRAQDLPENTSVLFGCSPNERAFEHPDWGHGAFTKCLLEELRALSANGACDTGVLAAALKRKVPLLVARISPRDTQTPKIFFTDSVDLKLNRDILDEKTLLAFPKLNSRGQDDAFPWVLQGGRVLYFTREAGLESAIYRAERADVSLPFSSPKRVQTGRQMVVTDDESYAVLLPKEYRPGDSFAELHRSSTTEPWSSAKPIQELAGQTNVKSPCLSGDGLTLVFQRARTASAYPGKSNEFAISQRASRRSPWGMPKLLPMTADPSLTDFLTWPCLSNDQRVLCFCLGGTRSSLVYLATRPSPSEPFGNYRPVVADGKPLTGRSPRYVPQSRAIYLSRDANPQEKDSDLYLFKDQAQLSFMPPAP